MRWKGVIACDVRLWRCLYWVWLVMIYKNECFIEKKMWKMFCSMCHVEISYTSKKLSGKFIWQYGKSFKQVRLENWRFELQQGSVSNNNLNYVIGWWNLSSFLGDVSSDRVNGLKKECRNRLDLCHCHLFCAWLENYNYFTIICR